MKKWKIVMEEPKTVFQLAKAISRSRIPSEVSKEVAGVMCY